jgi:multisubunit Na+/H+ antiporter MnhG subunit
MAAPATLVHHPFDACLMLLAYSTIIAAPVSGYLLARTAYSSGRARQPLHFHLSFIGN